MVNSRTISSHITWKHVIWSNPDFRERIRKINSETQKRAWRNPKYRARQRERCSVPKIKVELGDSKELFHVIGCLKGDGWVGACRRVNREGGYNFVINFYPGFSDVFARSFVESASRMGLHPKIFRRSNREIRVVAYSKMFVGWYKSLEISKIEEKIKRDRPLAMAFIRGFYEAEGSLCLFRKTEKPRLSLMGTNKDLMEMVFRVLRFHGYKVYLSSYFDRRYGRNQYMIRTSSRSEIIRFLEEINPCIKREVRAS